MSIKTETPNRGEFLVSEANGYRSREARILASGENLPAGRVVGQITATQKYVELDPSASDGSEIAAGILYDNVDASATGTNADTEATFLVRDCEVRDGTGLTNDLSTLFDSISWPSGITDPQKLTATNQLAGLGIILRTGGTN